MGLEVDGVMDAQTWQLLSDRLGRGFTLKKATRLASANPGVPNVADSGCATPERGRCARHFGSVSVAEPMQDSNKRWMFIVALLAGIAVGGVAVMIGSDTQKDPAPTVSNESVSTESASPYPPAGTPTASRAEGAGTDALAREDDSVAVIDPSAEHHATGEIVVVHWMWVVQLM